jgi:hypothetical protein
MEPWRFFTLRDFAALPMAAKYDRGKMTNSKAEKIGFSRWYMQDHMPDACLKSGFLAGEKPLKRVDILSCSRLG